MAKNLSIYLIAALALAGLALLPIALVGVSDSLGLRHLPAPGAVARGWGWWLFGSAVVVSATVVLAHAVRSRSARVSTRAVMATFVPLAVLFAAMALGLDSDYLMLAVAHALGVGGLLLVQSSVRRWQMAAIAAIVPVIVIGGANYLALFVE